MMYIKMSFTQSNLLKYSGLEHYCGFEVNLQAACLLHVDLVFSALPTDFILLY